MTQRIGLFSLLIIFLFLFSCRKGTMRNTSLFKEIVYNDSTDFRGVYLGSTIRSALSKEQPAQPDHRDKLGLSYTFQIDSSATMMVDYYSDALKSEDPTDQIASIVANILLNDEVKAAKLYSELRSYLNDQCGISNGVYGDLTWETNNKFTPSMEVRLELDDNKKEITLNFIDTQPDEGKDSTLNGIAIDTFFQVKN